MASTLAGGFDGGAVTHDSGENEGQLDGGLAGGVVGGLGGGVTCLGGEVKLSGENEGQLDGGLSGGVVGDERDGGRGGAMSARLNPRPLRATRPSNPSDEQLAGPAPSPGRRRFPR